MKAEQIYSYLLERFGTVQLLGDPAAEVGGFSSLYQYRPATLTWARHVASAAEVESDSFACLITRASEPPCEKAACEIKVADPRAAFFAAVDRFWGEVPVHEVSPKALIEEGAVIGENVAIGAFTVVSGKAVIGRDTVIGANVTIRGKVRIGERCVIQSGAVIGEDGYAFTKEEGKLVFVKHYGGVTIGDDVFIGANACVCRGTIDDTVIHDMAKLGNLCQVAHNVVIGERVEVIAGTRLMGSVKVGDDTWVATSMVRDQRTVGKNCVIGMGSVVVKDVPDGVTVAGNPARPFERKEKI